MAFFILFSQFAPDTAFAAGAPSAACQKAEQKFQKNFRQLEKKYRAFNNSEVISQNAPSWSWGEKKKAVYLLHGFIGSPEEMSGTAEKMKREGYTVINDIIPGYGAAGEAGSETANNFTAKDWKSYLRSNLNAVRSCFKEIHLVGFSTGGLLLHDYVRQNQKYFSPRTITLYSPFYQSHYAFTEFLRAATRWLTPLIPIKPFYTLTRFPDVKVAVMKPDHYLRDLPLDAAREVVQFGDQVSEEIQSRPMKNSRAGLLLFVSEADQIMDLDSTVDLVIQDFPHFKLEKFQKTAWVPHHLMVEAVSPVAKYVQDETVKWILIH